MEVLPYDKTPAVPQLAKVRFDPVPDRLKDLLTIGKPTATSVTWEQMGRGS
jgi:hypothetical protein